jgi:hypothetical protein
MNTEYLKSVAEGIWEILRCSAFVLMSWGVTDYKETTYKEMQGIRFKVNGFLFKGTVIVVLNEGADLYEIYCLNSDGKVVKSHDGIFCDELVDSIDKLIEKDSSDEDYTKNVNKWLVEDVVQCQMISDDVA